MVLSKEEVDESKARSFEEALGRIQKDIDKSLSRGSGQIYSKTIMNTVLYNKEEFLKFVMDVYKTAGWGVRREIGDDQRDNSSWDYLMFN